MAEHLVRFENAAEPVRVPTGTLLSEAARLAGLEINQPCGGQGRCGRCAVQVLEGKVRQRSTLRLSQEDIDAGYVLGCQSVVEGDVSVHIPPQDKIERRLTTDLTVADVQIPDSYLFERDQTVQRYYLEMAPPSMDDQTDDYSRVVTALRQNAEIDEAVFSLPVIQKMGAVLRSSDWKVTAVIDRGYSSNETYQLVRVIDLLPGHVSERNPLWGIAVDIGTTTVTLWLVDLITGEVKVQVSEYNGQIMRGEDVISRIVYASKGNGAEELRQLVVDTINSLLNAACKRMNRRLKSQNQSIDPHDVVKATISGNSTMMHLLLGIDATSIRLTPFVTSINHIPLLHARELGIAINPEGTIDCLPGVASYVGADITAGVLSSGMDDTEKVTLFMDVGTNGEIVLGSHEWLVTCACSAGPAFEGAGVEDGMRATKGAIEEVWINAEDFKPTIRVIGDTKPIGICGSGLLSLLAEMFMTGVVDKAGHLNTSTNSKRIREGKHGFEYVVSWASESGNDRDIVITHVDIDNLIRAKGAIFAGYSVLSESVGVPLELVEQMLVGGSFGKYINVEKAIEIGLLPDLPWDRFEFLGNTSVRGAYMALLDRQARKRISNIASRMTYIELSADNSFYDAFMSALFLPHTDMTLFPSVAESIQKK